MLSALMDAMTGTGLDFTLGDSFLSTSGPYTVIVLAGGLLGWLICYLAEEEPEDAHEAAEAWSRVELLHPGLGDARLAGLIETHIDGKTVCVVHYTT